MRCKETCYSPVRRIYKKKKGEESRKKKKREEEAEGEEEGNGTGSSRKGEEMRSDSILEQHALPKEDESLYLFLFCFSHSQTETIHASGSLSMKHDSRHATPIDIEYRTVR